MGKSLTLHTGGNWAGAMPSFSELEHECAEDFNSYLYDSSAVETSALGEPGRPGRRGRRLRDQEPDAARLLARRNVPLTGTGSGVYNSDLAFKDNLVFAGTYEGFRIIDFTDKTNPTEVVNYTGCDVGQGDVIVYGNILVRSWDSPGQRQPACAPASSSAQGFEGIHVFDISNPAEPKFVPRSSASPRRQRAGAPSAAARTRRPPCRTRRAATLYIYNGGS